MNWAGDPSYWRIPIPPDLGVVNRTMETFCIDGLVMWEVSLHRMFWQDVANGHLGLNPKAIFKREYVN